MNQTRTITRTVLKAEAWLHYVTGPILSVTVRNEIGMVSSPSPCQRGYQFNYFNNFDVTFREQTNITLYLYKEAHLKSKSLIPCKSRADARAVI
jgi:hypothetical protein